MYYLSQFQMAVFDIVLSSQFITQDTCTPGASIGREPFKSWGQNAVEVTMFDIHIDGIVMLIVFNQRQNISRNDGDESENHTIPELQKFHCPCLIAREATVSPISI